VATAARRSRTPRHSSRGATTTVTVTARPSAGAASTGAAGRPVEHPGANQRAPAGLRHSRQDRQLTSSTRPPAFVAVLTRVTSGRACPSRGEHLTDPTPHATPSPPDVELALGDRRGNSERLPRQTSHLSDQVVVIPESSLTKQPLERQSRRPTRWLVPAQPPNCPLKRSKIRVIDAVHSAGPRLQESCRGDASSQEGR
jgi:hypothetical protein